MKKKGASLTITKVIGGAIALFILLVLGFCWGAGVCGGTVDKFVDSIPWFRKSETNTPTKLEQIRYDILTEELTYSDGNNYLEFDEDLQSVGNKRLSKSKIGIALTTDYYFKNSLRGERWIELTPVIRQELYGGLQQEGDIYTVTQASAATDIYFRFFKGLKATNGLYTIKQASATTDIYFRYNNAWQWTPDKENWATVPDKSVNRGRFGGQQPVSGNLVLIAELEGKSFEEGLEILSRNQEGSYNVWQWTPDKKEWLTVPDINPQEDFKNRKPVPENIEIIQSLEGKNEEEGINILLNAENGKFDLVILGTQKFGLVSAALRDKENSNTVGLLELDILGNLMFQKTEEGLSDLPNTEQVAINKFSPAYFIIESEISKWRNSVLTKPVTLPYDKKIGDDDFREEANKFCPDSFNDHYLVIDLSKPKGMEATTC